MNDVLAVNCVWATSNRGALARKRGTLARQKGEEAGCNSTCCKNDCEMQYMEQCTAAGFADTEYVRVVADLRTHVRHLGVDGRRIFFADRLDNKAYELAEANVDLTRRPKKKYAGFSIEQFPIMRARLGNKTMPAPNAEVTFGPVCQRFFMFLTAGCDDSYKQRAVVHAI